MSVAHATTVPLSRRDGLVLSSVAALAGMAAFLGDWRLVVVVALTLPVATVVFLLHDRSAPAPPAPLPRIVILAAPLAWVGTSLLPDLRLLGGDDRGVGAAASGSASADIMLQLAVAVVVLAGVVWLLGNRWQVSVPPLVAAFLGYPALVVLSVGWTRLRIFTMGRAIEFVAIGALLVVMTAIVRSDREAARRVYRRAVQVYVAIVLPLAAWMFVSPRHWDGRLMWPGSHPNTSGAIVGLAVVLLLIEPRWRPYPMLPVPAVALAAGLGTVQVMIDSRGTTTAMIVAVVAILTVRATRDSRLAGYLAGCGVVVAAAVIGFAWEAVFDFVLRDQSEGQVLGFNGRRDLWNDILANPVGNEIWGVGMGAARGLLPAHWAGHAHNAWIDLLLSLGVIGVGLVTGLLVAAVAVGLQRRVAPAVGLIAYSTVLGVNTTSFHEPGVLLGAVVLAVPLLFMGDPHVVGASTQFSETPRASRPSDQSGALAGAVGHFPNRVDA